MECVNSGSGSLCGPLEPVPPSNMKEGWSIHSFIHCEEWHDSWILRSGYSTSPSSTYTSECARLRRAWKKQDYQAKRHCTVFCCSQDFRWSWMMLSCFVDLVIRLLGVETTKASAEQADDQEHETFRGAAIDQAKHICSKPMV